MKRHIIIIILIASVIGCASKTAVDIPLTQEETERLKAHYGIFDDEQYTDHAIIAEVPKVIKWVLEIPVEVYGKDQKLIAVIKPNGEISIFGDLLIKGKGGQVEKKQTE